MSEKDLRPGRITIGPCNPLPIKPFLEGTVRNAWEINQGVRKRTRLEFAEQIIALHGFLGESASGDVRISQAELRRLASEG